jgi:hypothetical protein
MVIFTYICVFRLSILVSVGPSKYEKLIASEINLTWINPEHVI